MGRNYLSFSVETELTFPEVLGVMVTGEIPEGQSRKLELLYDLSQLTDRDVKSISLDYENGGKVTATVHFTSEDRRRAIEQILLTLE